MLYLTGICGGADAVLDSSSFALPQPVRSQWEAPVNNKRRRIITMAAEPFSTASSRIG